MQVDGNCLGFTSDWIKSGASILSQSCGVVGAKLIYFQLKEQPTFYESGFRLLYVGTFFYGRAVVTITRVAQ